jgi:hypothetical protein
MHPYDAVMHKTPLLVLVSHNSATKNIDSGTSQRPD